ncbi:hypothetical protein AMTR_s00039p00065940 [Amborella trichopoda]|uniref:FBD domain-containing protein n=1 Tax=Amborella trichopoda TaxID=13333 RepID=U5D0H1_AMBTC|nr:hypothetical protein AMTR_s00039p00065940 [Amborella trichopoda]
MIKPKRSSKKGKSTSAIIERCNSDRLSGLPQPIIHLILSFLPIKEAGFSNIRTLKLKGCIGDIKLLQDIASNSPFLETLEICDSVLPPFSTFGEFCRVKYLYLRNCKLPKTFIQSIATKSTLLEHLLIDGCYGFEHLEVCLPNLVVLHVTSKVTIHLMNTPRPEEITLSPYFSGLQYQTNYNWQLFKHDVFRGDVVRVKTLSLGSRVMLGLSSVGLFQFYNLSKLVVGVYPSGGMERNIVSKLLSRSPHLKILIIADDPIKYSYCYYESDSFWETEGPFDCLNDHLETIHISLPRIYPLDEASTRHFYDTDFVKFLLVNSLVLKKMKISVTPTKYMKEERKVIMRDLRQVEWASSQVELIIS